MAGLVIRNIIPKSIRNEIILASSVWIVKLSLNCRAVSIIDASIKLKITMKIVDIIIPAFHAHAFPLNVSTEKISKILPKIKKAIVIKTIPKNNIASQLVVTYSFDVIYIKSSREYAPKMIKVKPNNAHRVTNRYRIFGLSFNNLSPDNISEEYFIRTYIFLILLIFCFCLLKNALCLK